MDVLEGCLERYRRELEFYRAAATAIEQRCRDLLSENGIRAIVSSRPKDPESLRRKLSQRAPDRGYTTVEEALADIVDLAGVRIALYFPSEIESVERIISENFTLRGSKVFPRDSTRKKLASYDYRFAGYCARHYRLAFRDALVEVQVASLLMHAWSEVEHDLGYKPVTGELSLDELEVLDEINGVVMAAEIALGRLQRAVEQRVGSEDQPFRNHFELASFLHEHTR